MTGFQTGVVSMIACSGCGGRPSSRGSSCRSSASTAAVSSPTDDQLHELRIRIELGTPDEETPAQKRNRQDEERQEAAEKSIESDPNVMAVRKAFDATVDPASIKPVNH